MRRMPWTPLCKTAAENNIEEDEFNSDNETDSVLKETEIDKIFLT